MKRNGQMNGSRKARAYTLVELLVAVAILVIMMGFLFQFVIGAQRIWSASEKKVSNFDSAQIALDVIETDLHNMQYSNEAGRTMPFYVWKKSADEVAIAFFADYKSSNSGNDETKVGTYPVIYYYRKDAGADAKGVLYRIALDDKGIKFNSSNGGGTKTVDRLWYLYGADYTTNSDFFGAFIKTAFSESSEDDARANLSKYDVLAEDIESFDVSVLLGNSNDSSDTPVADKTFDPAASDTERFKRYAPTRPKVVKLDMKIDNNKDDNDKSVTANSFTKVIFL